MKLSNSKLVLYILLHSSFTGPFMGPRWFSPASRTRLRAEGVPCGMPDRVSLTQLLADNIGKLPGRLIDIVLLKLLDLCPRRSSTDSVELLAYVRKEDVMPFAQFIIHENEAVS